MIFKYPFESSKLILYLKLVCKKVLQKYFSYIYDVFGSVTIQEGIPLIGIHCALSLIHGQFFLISVHGLHGSLMTSCLCLSSFRAP